MALKTLSDLGNNHGNIVYARCLARQVLFWFGNVKSNDRTHLLLKALINSILKEFILLCCSALEESIVPLQL